VGQSGETEKKISFQSLNARGAHNPEVVGSNPSPANLFHRSFGTLQNLNQNNPFKKSVDGKTGCYGTISMHMKEVHCVEKGRAPSPITVSTNQNETEIINAKS